MSCIVVMQSKNTGYEGKPTIYTIGGFTVNVQGEEFNFDFTEAYHSCNVDSEGRITVESELRFRRK